MREMKIHEGEPEEKKVKVLQVEEIHGRERPEEGVRPRPAAETGVQSKADAAEDLQREKKKDTEEEKALSGAGAEEQTDSDGQAEVNGEAKSSAEAKASEEAKSSVEAEASGVAEAGDEQPASERSLSEEATSQQEQQEYEARRERRRQLVIKRRKKRRRRKILLFLLLLLLGAAAAVYFTGYWKQISGEMQKISTVVGQKVEELQTRISKRRDSGSEESEDTGKNTEAGSDAAQTSSVGSSTTDDGTAANVSAQGDAADSNTIDITEEPEDTSASQDADLTEEEKAALRQAKKYAQQYDYDSAIQLLKALPTYSEKKRIRKSARYYKKLKDSCVSWPLEEVTHVFYHSLIVDTDKAFDGDYKQGDYDQVMTTIDEFNKITQTMYDKGYVMVSIYDMATVNADGTMTPGEIRLPEGKIPFILSQDDVCYYHYMDGDGFASKLVVDENGKVRNEYVEDDGSVSVGDYDMVPLIDRFVEEHPDFSYRGAKGIIALTGYNGILGYRTDSSYETRPDDLDANKVAWLDAHPEFSLETERQGAQTVAAAMKEEGWLFASHTWGHQDVAKITLEHLQADTAKFEENVDPLIGGTDIIIFAFGTDLTQGEDYYGDKFDYLKSQGYNYFCNVDSRKYTVQIRDTYFRQGRRNLDGYRMYYQPELLDDLFNTDDVFDPARPVPVPQMQ